MRQMVALRKQWDPYGQRVIGVRGNSDDAANTAITPIAEYFGVMIGQDPRTDQLTSQNPIFRGYSAARRDRAPIIECEDFRDEGARRYWDDYSPPYFGFKKGPQDTYDYTSESFAWLASNATGHTGSTASPTRTPRMRNGRAMPPFTSLTPMRMAGRIPAK